MSCALIVDDQEDNTAYLRALLQGHGYDVVAARHGAEALALARQRAPDIVISDLLMPVMDGYTLLRLWKSDDALARIPFVVYTATYTEREDEELARGLGADAFLLKPLEPDELLATIRAVEARPAARSAVASADDPTLLREYNQALIRKLEEKTLQLEEANRALRADLVAREAAEAALRASEASLRLLTEAMPQLVWMAEPTGANAFVNRRWIETTGLTAAASAGDGWLRAFAPGDIERVLFAWTQALSTGAPLSLEARLLRADGASVPCLVRAVSLRDADGRVTRWFGTCTDIQELKDAEERLRRTEEQLQHALRLEAIGRLAGGIAHDFNNLLTVMNAYTTFLREDAPDPGSMLDDIQQLDHAIERAVALNRQLLAYCRRHPVQPSVIVPGLIVTGMVPMLRRLLGETIEVVVEAPQPFARVVADAGQLEQIVMNLAVNARDAMPRGGRLAIEVHTVTPPPGALPAGARAGAHVRLGVADSGEGMDPATRARIFEPFFTTKERGVGTGLGLATVYGIVRQSGGHIEVTSAPGRGTRFDAYFPCTDQPTSAGDAPPAHVETLRGSETVLLVDDDEHVRQALRQALARSGYEVVEAHSPGEALLLAEDPARAIHALVTDVMMRHMSGLELARRLLQARPALAVLYVSGDPDGAAAAADAPPGPVLEKPVAPEALRRRLRELLDRRPSARR